MENNIIWKPIKNYELLYKINNFGEVKNRFNKKIKQYKEKSGYQSDLLQ